MGRKIGIDALAPVLKQMGFGQKFDLPVVSQNYGTVPSAEWKRMRFEKNPKSIERPDWTESDTLNTSIGQGFVIVNPLQLAMSAARIASGRDLQPRLIASKDPAGPPLAYAPEAFEAVRKGMWEVVNGAGTRAAAGCPSRHPDGR
jgi:penicillin-binding protein 2